MIVGPDFISANHVIFKLLLSFRSGFFQPSYISRKIIRLVSRRGIDIADLLEQSLVSTLMKHAFFPSQERTDADLLPSSQDRRWKNRNIAYHRALHFICLQVSNCWVSVWLRRLIVLALGATPSNVWATSPTLWVLVPATNIWVSPSAMCGSELL
jgi:hypothetical protein